LASSSVVVVPRAQPISLVDTSVDDEYPSPQPQVGTLFDGPVPVCLNARSQDCIETSAGAEIGFEIGAVNFKPPTERAAAVGGGYVWFVRLGLRIEHVLLGIGIGAVPVQDHSQESETVVDCSVPTFGTTVIGPAECGDKTRNLSPSVLGIALPLDAGYVYPVHLSKDVTFVPGVFARYFVPFKLHRRYDACPDCPSSAIDASLGGISVGPLLRIRWSHLAVDLRPMFPLSGQVRPWIAGALQFGLFY
jgi:hypothetical protein